MVHEAIKSVGCDRSVFWRLLKRSRNSSGCKIFAIRDKSGKVLHDLPRMLETKVLEKRVKADVC